MRKLKADSCSHTVSKKSKSDIESLSNEWHKHVQQRRNGSKRLFLKAVATTGKLNGTDFYPRRQSPLPIAEHPSTAPRMRKTEQPDISWLTTPTRAEPFILWVCSAPHLTCFVLCDCCRYHAGARNVA